MSASGAWPDEMLKGFSFVSVIQLMPIVAPRPSSVPTVPSAFTSCAKPWTEPAATATPSTDDAVSTTEAGTRSRVLPNSALMASGCWTTTSVPALLVANMLSNVLPIVSVSTIVPAMNATPSTTATPVSAKRTLCVHRFLIVKRNMISASQC